MEATEMSIQVKELEKEMPNSKTLKKGNYSNNN